MCSFDDLKFGERTWLPGVQAKLAFDNGYSVSVIQGYGTYTNGPDEWEVAVMYGNELVYDTPITNDVIGHLSREGVTEVMRQVAALPPRD